MRVVFLFTLVLFLYSCQKEIHFPETEPPVTTGINIHYKPLHAASTQFELIITDSVNKVLIDTMLNVNQDHSISFAEGPYSLTTIEYDNTEKRYKSKTYINAQATNWHIRPIDERQGLGNTNIVSGADAKIMYENVPAVTGFPYYRGSQTQTGSTVSITPMPARNKIEVSYKRLDQYIAYLMIPSAGLYKIHQTTSTNDVVDCSQMDAAKKINYTKPANLINSYIDLYGFLNTANYSNGVQLFQTDQVIFGDEYDLIYPDKGIARYFLYGLFFDADGGQFTYNSFGDAVPQNIDFIDRSYFDIASNEPNNFEIEFLKAAPSFYFLTHNSAKLSHVIYAGADQKAVDPAALVSVLSESELLGGENLSSYRLNQVSYYKADDLSYPGYFNYMYNPAPSDEKIKLSRTYSLPLQ